MSTTATDSDSEDYGANRQKELYEELRQLVKNTEAGSPESHALDRIIKKLTKTYPEGRRHLKKKLLVALKGARDKQAYLQEALDNEKKAKESLDEKLRAASVAVNQAKKREAALQDEINDETKRAKQAEAALIEASKGRERRETEFQQKLTSAQNEVKSLAEALAKEQELSKRSADAVAALEEQLSQENEEGQRRTQASDSKIAAQADFLRQQGDQATKRIADLQVKHEQELEAAIATVESKRRQEMELHEKSKQELVRRLDKELSIARGETTRTEMEREEERESFRRAEKTFRQEMTELNDALDEAQKKLAITTRALDTKPTVAGPFPSANDRKDALEAAFDDRVFSDKKNWEKLKKKYPDLWREQTFSTWGEVKASLPHNVIRELRDKMHFRWKDGSGESVETTVFFDTGNHVGPLLSHIKLESLGCTMGNVDTTDRLAFRGATGEVGFTLGTITLERVQQITTSVKASESAKTFLKFHVWKDPIGLAEIMFGGDENSKFRPGKDGVPPLLCTFPLTTMRSSEKSERAWGRFNREQERKGLQPVDYETFMATWETTEQSRCCGMM